VSQNAKELVRLRQRVELLEGHLYDQAIDDDCCTCERQSWVGPGHTFGCCQGDARWLLGRSAFSRIKRERSFMTSSKARDPGGAEHSKNLSTQQGKGHAEPVHRAGALRAKDAGRE